MPFLLDDVRRDIFGETAKGEYGINYQINRLNCYALKAVYFVESLFGSGVRSDILCDVVRTIRSGGHEVQLHLHTEWLNWIEQRLLPGRTGQHLKDFTLDEQTFLIGEGMRNLRECGVASINAFRAGNFGANFDTLRALVRNGIVFDSSHNTGYLNSPCELKTEGFLVQPRDLHGILEVPISFFQDYPGHYRPAHIAACSSSEMSNALIQAWKRGWTVFVIVTHSFELLNKRKDGPDKIAVRRFEDLCRFLAENSDKFRTTTFAEISPQYIANATISDPLTSKILRTAWRFGEQAVRRWLN